MFTGLIRVVLVGMVLVAVAFFLVGYWANGSLSFPSAPVTANETSRPIDTRAARERGAELGEHAAQAAASVTESLEQGALTAKIKAKMVLDDLVKARNVNVTTTGTTVTLSGTVHSEKERERAVQLATETKGVTKVLDQLVIRAL